MRGVGALLSLFIDIAALGILSLLALVWWRFKAVGGAREWERNLVTVVAVKETETSTETLASFPLYNLDSHALAGLQISSQSDFAVDTAAKLTLDEVLVDHATTTGMGLDVKTTSLKYPRCLVRSSGA